MRGMIENMVLMQYLFFVFLLWKGGQGQDRISAGPDEGQRVFRVGASMKWRV